MNKDQICRGCLVFEEGRCHIVREYYFKKCPCINCLIKGMCQEICDDFEKFVDGATEHEFED